MTQPYMYEQSARIRFQHAHNTASDDDDDNVSFILPF